ncbi:MAG: MATE family efflux transporter [Alphaproteobacteria bacterium]
MSKTAPTLTRRYVLSLSWPFILANAAAPLVGLVDTFVIGRYEDTSALAGIGLGAVIYAIAYWGFGFLRMSTTGLVAQSDGEGDQSEVQAHLARAIPIGLLIGLLILIFQTILMAAAFTIFTAPEDIETTAEIYIKARLWGLPATLASLALMGWFVGISRPRRALTMQIVLNIINAGLSLYFVAELGLGLFGVGIASAIAEWAGLGAGLILAVAEIRTRGGFARSALTIKALTKLSALRKLGISNSNIFIRTLSLTVGFSFLGNAAANEGEIFLAGNHILMQFITMVALILDAFAHTAEAATGSAFGAKNRDRFNRAVRLTSEFSALFGLLCGAVIILIGPLAITLLTKDPLVQESARTFLPYCALAPVLGFAAWQMDGIFIGTNFTKEMRNAGIASVIIYIGLHYVFQPRLGGHGLWIAFLGYYIARALTLGYYIPVIYKKLEPEYGNPS